MKRERRASRSGDDAPPGDGGDMKVAAQADIVTEELFEMSETISNK